MSTVLRAENLGINFGGLKAVSRFDLDLKTGELVGLIGPNGAGKTTVFNMLTGVYTPTEGSILLMGKPTLHKRPDQLVKMGIARTFQNIRLFKGLSVLDNVRNACNFQMKYNLLESVLRLPGYWREEEAIRTKAIDILKVFGMENQLDVIADNLPYGQQRKLEIARALATDPTVLLLDEPAAGMNPTETNELMATINTIRQQFSTSILLIEHDMSLVLGICHRIIVLDYGQIIASGLPNDIINDKRVITAYLGEDDDAES